MYFEYGGYFVANYKERKRSEQRRTDQIEMKQFY